MNLERAIPVVLLLLAGVLSPARAQTPEVVEGYPEARPCLQRVRILPPPEAPAGTPPFERRVIYAYDAEGRLERVAHDGCADFEVSGEPCWTPADGTVDQLRLFIYDEGRLHGEVWDVHADGQPDIANRFVYDEGGNRLQDLTDYGADGIVERQIEYENDGAGRPVLVRFDSDGDGVVDYIVRHHYEGEHEVRLEEDAGADGVIELVVVYEYDPSGRRVRESQDMGSDGQPDEVTVWRYEGDDAVVEERDLDGDGVMDASTSWELDEQGRPVRRAIHVVEIEGVVAEDLFEYECEAPSTPPEQ